MKTIDTQELKVIQMDILEAIDKFCTENDIRYSLACGTMLGAVRHKGYIPWDDDIDIYLLRNEYEKLMSLFPEVYNEHYRIYSLERNGDWDRPYAKAFDDRTVFVEKAYHDISCGVNIDIFPVDEVPENEIQWDRFNRKRKKLYLRYWNSVEYFPIDANLRSHIIWLYLSIHRFLFPRKKLASALDKYCKTFRGQGYMTVFECCVGILQKHPFNKKVFDRIVDYPFEDRVFKGFENYDEYLRNGFGDYMTLPPVEKRTSHHFYEAYWK